MTIINASSFNRIATSYRYKKSNVPNSDGFARKVLLGGTLKSHTGM